MDSIRTLYVLNINVMTVIMKINQTVSIGYNCQHPDYNKYSQIPFFIPVLNIFVKKTFLMKKYHLLLLSLLSGIILSIAWPLRGFPVLLFIGFVPLLFIEDYISNNREKFNKFACFFYVFPGFFIWNLLTTWWIYHATFFGVSMAVFFNTLFMAVVFNLFHITKRNLINNNHGYLAYIAYWLCFEYFHMNWDLSWSWLTLGNGFAPVTKWVQWYEYTGHLGGSVWIIIANISIYKLVRNILKKSKEIRKIIVLSVTSLLIIVIPIIISLSIYYNYEEVEDPVDIVIIQPNIDPYLEQYITSPAIITNRILNLARQKVDSEVDFVVAPESSIQEYLWHDRMEYSRSIDSLRQFLKNYPDLSFVIGLSSRDMIDDTNNLPEAARKIRNGYYQEFNTGILLDNYCDIQIYHKSKHVPGVEKMPYPKLFKPLKNFAIDLGGTIGTIGVSEERTVFISGKDSVKIAPVICYESIYGEFCAKFVRNGAELIFIITNDGWWEETAGHRQHMEYSRLRTIETRRSLARSANTGISAFINQRGDVFQRTKYWEPDVIRQKINRNSKLTFYVIFGDYLGRIFMYISALLILVTIVMKVKNKRL